MERRMLRPAEVEEVYRIDAGTLANWRCQGRGPAFSRCGRIILYPVDALEEWIRKYSVRTADQDELP